MSPLPGDPMWHVSCRSGVATLRTAIHLLLTYSSDHSTDAGRSTSSGASGRYGPKGGCCYRPATQTEGRTDTRPLHRRLLHTMRPTSKNAACCCRRSGVVCLCLCPTVTTTNSAKTVEPIQMPFWMWTRRLSRNHALDRGPYLATGTGTLMPTYTLLQYV